MHIKKGSYRMAIIFPQLNFVIKLPRIRPFKAIKCLMPVRKHYLISIKFQLFHSSARGGGVESYKWYLWRGIINNWSERKFYKRTKHPFLQPTYFSLFGLINLQKRSLSLEASESDFLQQLRKLTEWKVDSDGHHFRNSENFCQEEGKLRIVDYSDIKTQKIILEFGLKIHTEFSFQPEPNKKG